MAANDFLAAIVKRLKGDAAAAPKPVDRMKILKDSLAQASNREDQLREATARRLLEAESFREGGSSVPSRMMRGAGIGLRTALQLPTEGNAGLAGLVAGISGLTGVHEQEGTLGKERESEATSALSGLISEDRARSKAELEGETGRTEATAKMLDQVESPRVLKEGDAPGDNEIAFKIGGINYAGQPKNRMMEMLIKAMSVSGKGAGDINKQVYEAYQRNSALLKTEKNFTPDERGRLISEIGMQANFLKGSGYPVAPVAAPTRGELAPPSIGSKIVGALSGAKGGATLRVPGALDLEQSYNLAPGSLSNVPQEALDRVNAAPPENRERALKLFIEQYGGK